MKKKKKTGLWIGLAILVVLIIGFFIFVGRMASKLADGMSMPVTVAEATTEDIQDIVKVTGDIVSAKKQVVYSEITGQVADVNAELGQKVKAGDQLITFSEKTAKQALERAQLAQDRNEASYDKVMAGNNKNVAKKSEADTNLSVLKQQIADWEKYIDNLKSELNKNMRSTNNNLAERSVSLRGQLEKLQGELALLTPGTEEFAAKEAEIQDVQTQLQQIQVQSQTAETNDYVTQMQDKIAKAQEELAEFKQYEAEMKSQQSTSESMMLDSYDKKQWEIDNKLSDMSYNDALEAYELAQKGISAEVSGVVTECMVVPGMGIVEGTRMIEVSSIDNLDVETFVSQSDWEKLSVGQKVDIVFKGQTFTGAVKSIDHMATMQSTGSSAVRVLIHIDEPGEEFVLGLSAKLTIYTKETAGAVTVPIEAINADRDGDYVYVVKDGIVEKRYVTCGISTGLTMEIIEGISEKEQVVVESYTELTDGMAVNAVMAE